MMAGMSGEDADRWVAFVKARLDEDEAVAWAAASPAFRHWHVEPWYDGNFMADGRTANGDLWGDTGIQFTGQGALETLIGDHIARHDPARALRQVATMRRILLEFSIPPGTDAVYGGTERETGFRYALSFTIKALAMFWSDHPDYAAMTSETEQSISPS